MRRRLQPLLVTHKGPHTGFGQLAFGLHAALRDARLVRLDADAATVWERPAGEREERALLRLPRGANRFAFYKAAMRRLTGPFHFTNQNLSYLATRQDVVTVADLHHLHHGSLAKRIVARRLYSGLRRARGIAAISSFARDETATWTGRDDVAVVPPSITSVRATAAARHARPAGRYVLAVGSDTPRKNVPGLLAAFAAVVRRRGNHDLRLVKVGAAEDARDRERHVTMATRLQVADRIDWRDDVTPAHLASLYAGASAVVVPSFYEGFGLPAIEAMTHGAPVVVSHRTALPETVGDAALVVPPEPDALAAALARILDDDRLADELRRRGLHRAASFTPALLARRTRSWYGKVWP